MCIEYEIQILDGRKRKQSTRIAHIKKFYYQACPKDLYEISNTAKTALNQSCLKSRSLDNLTQELIQFADRPDNSSNEGVLETKELIDREHEDIIKLNGILTYDVKVSDAAGNFENQKVKFFTLVSLANHLK